MNIETCGTSAQVLVIGKLLPVGGAYQLY
jgi:hypothetical protein